MPPRKPTSTPRRSTQARSISKASGHHESETREHRLYGALAYMWVLCAIPLIMKKDSSYAQFHAKQGLVIVCAWLVLWLLAWLPLLNILIAFPGMVLLLAVNLLALIRAYNGERWKIPYLYDYVLALNL